MTNTSVEIKIKLPDGNSFELPKEAKANDLANKISPKLAKLAVGAIINDELKDLASPLKDGDQVKILKENEAESLELLRHSCAHVMAQAVQSLYPQAKIAIGPTIEDGFYYDFEIPNHSLTEDDLSKIEDRMHEICKQEQNIVRYEIPNIDKQLAEFKEIGEKFKAELLEEHKNECPTLYLMTDKDNKTIWNDLCRGPHLPNTKFIKHFKLLKVSGSYWRADETKEHLQRVYATCFWTKNDLDAYIKRLEEAKARDHRNLTKNLDLFSIHDEVGPGLIFWHPNLGSIRTTIEDYWRSEHRARDYEFVYTPHIASEDLYAISGHLSSYGENMYSSMDIDEKPYRVKPMNCPGHIMIYKSKLRSYRDLPLRFFELGTVYRYERSGVLHGMLRVRGFTQDDSHIFCTPETLTNEINGILDLIQSMAKTFGFTYQVYLSTRPEKYLGTDEEWELATNALSSALKMRDINYEIDPGGGVFYAPKIDVKLFDAIGRQWQGPTIQVDLNLPNRFDVNYIGEDGNRHKVIMVHRAVLGSLERFVGILIEHYAGAFPTWLAPVQAMVIPISDKHIEHAKNILTRLKTELKARVKIDTGNDTLNYKIRQAQLEKIPYMLIVGDKEIENNEVSVRHRKNGNLGNMSIEKFFDMLAHEINAKANN